MGVPAHTAALQISPSVQALLSLQVNVLAV
jgi:hypothetical protein